MSTKIILHIVLLLASCCIMEAQAAKKTPARSTEEVVHMERWIVSASKYDWYYANSPTFEILTDAGNLEYVSSIVKSNEAIIAAFSKDNPFFAYHMDLRIKLIYCNFMGMGRFFKDATEKYDDIDMGLSGARWDTEQMIIANVMANKAAAKNKWRVPASEEMRIVFNLYLKKCALRYGATANNAPWLYVALDRISRHAWLNYESVNVNRWSEELEKEGYASCLTTVKPPKELTGKPSLSLIEMFEYTPPQLTFEGNMPNYIYSDDIKRKGINRVTQLTQSDAWRFYTWATQSTDFVLYCLFGPDENLRISFERLVKNSGHQPVSDELFLEYFGKPHQQFHKEMYNYFKKQRGSTNFMDPSRRTAWGPKSIAACSYNKKNYSADPKFQKPERSQSARIISDWLRTSGDPEAARRTLALAEEQEPDVLTDPYFAATLGLNNMTNGDEAKATTLLSQAAAKNIKRPRVYRELAAARMDSILAKQKKNYRFSESETLEIWKLLKTAHQQPQPNVKTYILISHLINYSATPPQQNTLTQYLTGCRQFSENIDLMELAVPVLINNNMKDEAKTLIDDGIKQTYDTSTKASLRKLAESEGL